MFNIFSTDVLTVNEGLFDLPIELTPENVWLSLKQIIVLDLIVLKTVFFGYENEKYKIKTSLLNLEGLKDQVYKTGTNLIIKVIKLIAVLLFWDF